MPSDVRSRRRRRPRARSVAHGALAGLLLLAACSPGTETADGRSPAASPAAPTPSPAPASPSPSAAASSSPSAPASAALAEPVELGPGLPEWLTDGAGTALVSVPGAEAPECPGEGPRALERVAVPDGNRSPVEGAPPAAGRVIGASPTDPTLLALLAVCDGVPTALYTARVGPDGGLGEVQSVAPHPDLPGLDVQTMQWARDGSGLLALRFGESGTTVMRAGLDGTVTQVATAPDGAILDVGQLGDGRFVYRQGVSFGVVVATPDGAVQTTFEGREGFAVSPDGGRLAVFGPSGLALVDAEGAMTDLTPDTVSGARWTPAGDSLVVVVGARGVPEADLRAVTVDGGAQAIPTSVDPFTPLVVAPDGRAVAAVRPLSPDAEPVVVVAPLPAD